MNRRDFLKLSGPLSAAPLLLNAIPVRSFFPDDVLLNTNCDEVSARALVIIKLDGGNDGLNTVIPLSEYDRYAHYRPKIRIPETGSNKYIKLDNSLSNQQQVGLHPSLKEIKTLYDEGFVNIIQGVGYPDHNRSHFKSSDLWETGGDSKPQNFNLDSGWIGRYLETAYEDLLNGANPKYVDPLGIHLGTTKVSLGFHTTQEHSVALGLEERNVSGFHSFISGVGGLPPEVIPNSDYGKELQFLIDTQNSTNVYAERISSVYAQGINAIDYPNYGLARRLQTIARLLIGGSQTKVFLTRLGGFDTHVNQLYSHERNLREFSASVKAFMDDLKALGMEKRVMVTTYSEFGRKIAENQNRGTDHGSFGPMMVIGAGANGGVTGKNPNLDKQNRGALAELQHDYRQVYATLMQDWLGADQEAIAAAKFDQFAKLSLVGSNLVVDPRIYNCRGGNVKPPQDEVIGEVGNLYKEQTGPGQWHRVRFKKKYENPVVILSPLSFRGNYPAFARVRRVRSDSFEYQITEWSYQDGAHVAEHLSYMVVEAGSYEIESGVKLIAGKTKAVNHDWKTIIFPQTFSKRPVVFSQCFTQNGSDYVITRQNNVFEDSFRIRLQEQESQDQIHVDEEVAWVAIEPFNQDEKLRYEAGNTGKVVTHEWHYLKFKQDYTPEPAFFAAMQSYEGSDPSVIRYQELTGKRVLLKVEEEKSYDEEIKHYPEDLGYWVFDRPGAILAKGESIEDEPDPACANNGSITWEIWRNVGGTQILDIPVNSAPSQTKLIPLFESTEQQRDYYGLRIRGYICPPKNGHYTFFISGDTRGELWLSPTDLPKNKEKIAFLPGSSAFRQWDKYSQQKSQKIYLKRGQRYYVEALLKEDIGGDHLSIGWQTPDNKLERPIPGKWLQPWDGGQAIPTVDKCKGTGRLVWETWTNVTGVGTAAIPTNKRSSKRTNIYKFEAPSNQGDYYGGRARGFICPPQTGRYTFYIAADNWGDLFLSSDHNPANKKRIARTSQYTNPRQWDKYPDKQKSETIFLIQGMPYYIEALLKEDNKNDHLAVGWKMPDTTLERPISGEWLIPWSSSKFQEFEGSTQATSREFQTNTPDLNRELAVSCYPNTFADTFHLAIGNPTAERAYVQVFSASGRLMFQREMLDLDQPHLIDGTSFAPGLYFVKVIVGSEVKSMQVTKQ
ncbi:MAG: DUF1501 domain-containing protein [Bacteroidota bacterium]